MPDGLSHSAPPASAGRNLSFLARWVRMPGTTTASTKLAGVHHRAAPVLFGEGRS